ncbi:MAG: sulfurtransferase TusA family protein [Pseudomonadota bacterium]
MLFDETLDTTGQRCPLPVLKARKRIKGLAIGAVLRLTSDDPLAAIDVPHFCNEDGHALVGQTRTGDATDFYIKKGG